MRNGPRRHDGARGEVSRSTVPSSRGATTASAGLRVLASSRVITPASTHAQRAAHRSPAEFSHPVTQLGGSDGRNRTAAPGFELLSKELAS